MAEQPKIPDDPRYAEYDPVSSTGPFPVGFVLFDDTGADLKVTLDGVPVAGWTLAASPAPGFYGAPNTWTGGAITFAAPITGKLRITGRRRPRRTSNYQEGRGIPARDLNTELNTVAAVQRELYDGFEEARGSVAEIAKARDETLVAHSETLGARDVTLAARDVAVAAKDIAVGARDLSLTYLNQTFSARNEGVAARDEAKAAATQAETYALIVGAAAFDFALDSDPTTPGYDWSM